MQRQEAQRESLGRVQPDHDRPAFVGSSSEISQPGIPKGRELVGLAGRRLEKDVMASVRLQE